MAIPSMRSLQRSGPSVPQDTSNLSSRSKFRFTTKMTEMEGFAADLFCEFNNLSHERHNPLRKIMNSNFIIS